MLRKSILLHNSKGSAAIIAIIAMMFLGLVGGAYATLSSSNVTTATRSRDMVAAQYLAEAGAQWALNYLPSHIADVPNNGTPLSMAPINRNAGTSTAGSFTVSFRKDVNDPGLITITSTGTVNNSSVRSVIITVRATGGNDGNSIGNGRIFGYAAFSQSDMTLNNSANINGNLRTNATLNINDTSVNVHGKANYTTLGANTWSKRSAVNDGVNNGDDLIKNTDIVTLDVDALMQQIPSISKTGTDLKTLIQSDAYSGKTYNLVSGSYYANGGYSGFNCNYFIPANQNVTIYVDGYFELNNNRIIGDEGSRLTIYSRGVNFAGNSSIQTPADGRVQLYSDGYIGFNQTSNINSGDVTIITTGGINFATNSSINNNVPNSIFRIYLPNGSMEFNNNSSFAQNGVGMIVASGRLHPNSNASAPTTVFISKGDIACDNSSVIGGAYANGTLNVNSSARITYSNAVMQALGLVTAPALPVLNIQTRNDH